MYGGKAKEERRRRVMSPGGSTSNRGRKSTRSMQPECEAVLFNGIQVWGVCLGAGSSCGGTDWGMRGGGCVPLVGCKDTDASSMWHVSMWHVFGSHVIVLQNNMEMWKIIMK